MKFDYAYFAVSVIGNGRFGDQNTVSAQAGQNAATPLEKLQQNKIELRDVQRQIADARTALEGKLKSVANVYTDSIIRSAIQEDEEDITSLIMTNSNPCFLRNIINTLKAISKNEKWKVFDDDTFYKQYLDILKNVSEELSANISTVEMLLFAKAEELIGKSFKPLN